MIIYAYSHTTEILKGKNLRDLPGFHPAMQMASSVDNPSAPNQP